MAEEVSRADRLIARIKNNRYLAVVIAFGVIVIALASFTDAVTKLTQMLPSEGQGRFAGNWQSDVLGNDATGIPYRLVLDLHAADDGVYGTARRMAPRCENSRAPICAGFGSAKAISAVVLKNRTLHFSVDWGEIAGSTPWTYYDLKQQFALEPAGAAMRLRVEDNLDSPPMDIKLERQGERR